MLDLPVPKLEGGKPQTIVAHPNDEQKAYMQVLAELSEAIHSGAVDPSEDNMLKITGEARLLGLDARCVIPNAENYPDSKVNLCIDKIMEIYDRTSAEKGVQAIFCDIAVNSDDGKFSVYDYLKQVVDATVMSLINGYEIKKEHFQADLDQTGCYLTREGLKIFLNKLERKFRTEVRYLKYTDSAVSFRRAILLQMDRLAKAIEEGDASIYEPIIIR